MIRCTSVDGHRLEGGADTDETVRNEIGSADAFVGILSDRSMRSKYVLIELGARWVLNKHLLPLVAPETPASVLGGPLAGKNALQADSEAQLHQLVREWAGAGDQSRVGGRLPSAAAGRQGVEADGRLGPAPDNPNARGRSRED